MGSLIAGIARGTPAQARRLASRGGLVMALLWAMSLLLVFLSPLALPADKGGSFFATTEISTPAKIEREAALASGRATSPPAGSSRTGRW